MLQAQIGSDVEQELCRMAEWVPML